LLGAYQIPFNDQPNQDNGQSADICEICDETCCSRDAVRALTCIDPQIDAD
jgi:hypothetical protein